jgi:hypothetical protein
VPLKVDVNAPRRWWSSPANGDYWFSIYGFHVNGVENGYRLDTLTATGFPYYYLIYWPNYDVSNDLFGPVFVIPQSILLHFRTPAHLISQVIVQMVVRFLQN